jgi:hypothetical protein
METMKVLPAELNGMTICRTDGCDAVILHGEFCTRCTEEMQALDAWASAESLPGRLTLCQKVLNIAIVAAALFAIWSVIFPFAFECLKLWCAK